MARVVFIGILTAFLVLATLGIIFLKDSYKILPMQATSQFEPGPFATWREFTAPGNKFRVKLPTFPQNATQALKDPKTGLMRHYDMYIAQKDNGSVFMISLIRFPETKDSPEIIQKTIINDLMAANPVNQLKDMKIGEFEQFKTLDFAIENNTMRILGRTFMDKNLLYLLSAIFPTAAYNPDEYAYFLNSFGLAPLTITPPTPQKPK